MHIDDRTSPIPRPVSVKTYRKEKLKMLSRDFCIKLTDEEIAHANELNTIAEIDQFFVTVLNSRWQ